MLGLGEIRTDSKPGDMIGRRAQRALDETDNMHGPLRQCVHEYGYAVVNSFRLAGVTEPRMIHQVMREIWEGPRQPTQRTGKKGHRPMLQKLDVLLIQAECTISAATLVRFLWDQNLIIVPREPTQAMVDASIDAVSRMGLVSKTEKHRGRLRFALRAAVETFWPHLVKGA